MAKIVVVSMKDLKERTPWVIQQARKHGFVVITKHGKVVMIAHKLSEKDFQITEEARARVGLPT